MQPFHSTGWARLGLAAALCVALISAPPAQAQAGDAFVPGEVVVKLWQAGDLTAVAAAFSLDPAPLAQFGARAIYRLRILDGAPADAKAQALAADARVQYAEPNFIAQTPEGRKRSGWAKADAVGYGAQWAPAILRLSEAHAVTQGAGVIVAVLDSGVDAAHPALAGRLLPGYDFVDMDADPGEPGAAGPAVTFGHGTHVAGLVALTAPEATILPVRVLDRNGDGNVWVLAEALQYAAQNGAAVINLSLSTTRPTRLLQEFVRAAACAGDEDDDDGADDDDDDCLDPTGRGIVVVAAAGNSGSSAYEYPAAERVNGALAVAASTEQDTLAAFSTYGPWVHVAAPGQDITSAVPGGAYAIWSGTSMAAPFVAGQAALVRAQSPHFTAAQTAERIQTTAHAIAGPVPRRIDVAASLGLNAPAANSAVFLPLIKR